jgi:phosphopantetheine adenylyltransferase
MAGIFPFKEKQMQNNKKAGKNIYSENGYKDRQDYLKSLAEEFDIELSEVITIADVLGPNEDFDALVTSLEDYSM